MGLISKAFACAKGRWGNLFAGFFVLAVTRLAALSPLAALYIGGEALPVALLCPVLIVFFILPLRFSTAKALNDFVNGGRFFSPELLSFKGYGRKLLMAIWQLIKIAVYAIPVAALCGYTVHHLQTTDFITTLGQLRNLGGSTDAGLMIYFAAFLVLTIPLLIGFGLNCAGRFFFARGQALPGSGERKYFHSGLISFLILLPALALVAWGVLAAALPFIQSLTRDRSGFLTARLLLPPAGLWYVATLPLRKLLTPLAIHSYALEA